MDNQTVRFIESKGKFGMKLGLESIGRLLEKLGNPQDDLTYIHVAGSNGKGSISRILECVLTFNGYHAGLYTSPHLEKFNERIRFDKEEISDKDLNRIFNQVRDACTQLEKEGYPYPTGFEIETAIAFLYFKEKKADPVILEVGLGGRLDATNVIKKSLLAIISTISLEHTKWLGDTLEKIALEKSAIVKEGSNVVISPQQTPSVVDTIVNDAKKRGAESIRTVCPEEVVCLDKTLSGQTLKVDDNNFNLPLIGSYQKNNFLTALRALEVLKDKGYKITRLEESLKTLEFPGRFEILSQEPVILIDGGHNPDGLKAFRESIQEYFGDKKVTLFFGILKDRQIDSILKEILPIAEKIYLLRPDNPEALDPEELLEKIKTASNIETEIIKEYGDIKSKIDLSKTDEIFAATGSLYLIGRLRPILKELINQKTTHQPV